MTDAEIICEQCREACENHLLFKDKDVGIDRDFCSNECLSEWALDRGVRLAVTLKDKTPNKKES
tara:strand:- start:5616 stop:5807 length:192 start_codon:yes stop_codon:yes gene_type:complete